jgi:hypothetical protein
MSYEFIGAEHGIGVILPRHRPTRLGLGIRRLAVRVKQHNVKDTSRAISFARTLSRLGGNPLRLNRPLDPPLNHYVMRSGARVKVECTQTFLVSWSRFLDSFQVADGSLENGICHFSQEALLVSD